MKTTYFITLLAVFLLLSGCASQPQPVVQLNSNVHQQNLANFDKWQLSGRLAFKSPEDKFSANLNWTQDQQAYRVKLTSFIGTSLLEMEGSPGFARIEADDKEYQGSDASRLIRRITGWNIPIEDLPVWIKGQVNPQDQATFDDKGLVKQVSAACFLCDNWQISFDQYKPLDDIWLPHRITLTNRDAPDNQIKIRINKWKKV